MDTDTVAGMQALGLHPGQLDSLRHLTFDRAQERLTKIQAAIKKRYKQLALELHPDRTGGDVEKTKLFSIVTEVNQKIQELSLTRQPIQPRRRFIFIRQTMATVPHSRGGIPFRGFTTQSTATNTTTATHYDARRVAFIRF